MKHFILFILSAFLTLSSCEEGEFINLNEESMYLPSDNISTTLVRNTLGASTNSVSELCKHPNMNIWSTRSPHGMLDGDVDNYLAWKLQSSGENYSSARLDRLYPNSPLSSRGYKLGDYRNYKHTEDIQLEWEIEPFYMRQVGTTDDAYGEINFTLTAPTSTWLSELGITGITKVEIYDRISQLKEFETNYTPTTSLGTISGTLDVWGDFPSQSPSRFELDAVFSNSTASVRFRISINGGQLYGLAIPEGWQSQFTDLVIGTDIAMGVDLGSNSPWATVPFGMQTDVLQTYEQDGVIYVTGFMNNGLLGVGYCTGGLTTMMCVRRAKGSTGNWTVWSGQTFMRGYVHWGYPPLLGGNQQVRIDSPNDGGLRYYSSSGLDPENWDYGIVVGIKDGETMSSNNPNYTTKSLYEYYEEYQGL